MKNLCEWRGLPAACPGVISKIYGHNSMVKTQTFRAHHSKLDLKKDQNNFMLMLRYDDDQHNDNA